MHAGFDVEKRRCRNCPQRARSLLGKSHDWMVSMAWKVSLQGAVGDSRAAAPWAWEVRRDFSEEGTCCVRHDNEIGLGSRKISHKEKDICEASEQWVNWKYWEDVNLFLMACVQSALWRGVTSGALVPCRGLGPYIRFNEKLCWLSLVHQEGWQKINKIMEMGNIQIHQEK